MNREQAFEQMLDAAARMQWNISMILEAKAVEAEKIRNWTIHHLNGQSFERQDEQITETLKIHEQVVELLEMLTKLENGLCSNLKAVLVESGESESESDMDGLFGGDFDLGDFGK